MGKLKSHESRSLAQLSTKYRLAWSGELIELLGQKRKYIVHAVAEMFAEYI